MVVLTMLYKQLMLLVAERFSFIFQLLLYMFLIARCVSDTNVEVGAHLVSGERKSTSIT